MIKSKLDIQNEILKNEPLISLAEAVKKARAEYKAYAASKINEFWENNPESEFFGAMYTRETLERAMGRSGAAEQVLASL